jgi:transcriptional regulator with PAS, ATPase and Fis domain
MADIIENLIEIFKISPSETITNIYGETSAATGKWYEPGILISCLVERPEMTTEQDDFGPNRLQTHVFKLREKTCKDILFYPESGDIVFWNDRYYEVNNVIQEQLLGGQAEKSHSIILNTQYTKLSSLNIVQRNPS